MDSSFEEIDPRFTVQLPVNWWCPACEPESELDLTKPWEMRYCNIHRPDESGTADEATHFPLTLKEPDFATVNRTVCALVHRQS